MSQDKYSQGGKYAPGRYNSVNHAYTPITNNGPSIGCITLVFTVMTIALYLLVQSF